MEHTQLSRRAVMAGIAGLMAYGIPAPAAADYLRRAGGRQAAQPIHPRADWAGTDHPPTGPIEAEDVRMLVVHHTLIPGNGYTEDGVAQLLRDIYDYHTGPEKNWPDIAYNFMVDRFGGVWETRAGSLAGPVQGSATGGNQGFSQLCCFLGDLTSEPPTELASASMADLLASLADRYSIDTDPGTTVTLISRGSTRFAAGEEMVVPTLAGHRDVSLTGCPGEAGYAFLNDSLPALVNARRTPPATPTTTTAPATTTTAPVTTAALTTTAVTDSTEDAGSTTEGDDDVLAFGADQEAQTTTTGGDSGPPIMPYLIGGVGLAAVGGGALALSRRDRDAETAAEVTELAADEPTDRTVAVAQVPAPTTNPVVERNDGTIDVPSRLGLSDDETTTSGGTTEEMAVPAPPVRPPGPQRVWWATAEAGSPAAEDSMAALAARVHDHAAIRPDDPEVDRLVWARLDTELTEMAGTTTAALVAARSNAVYVFRSQPCLVVVTSPDGTEKRDRTRDALRIARQDIAGVAVYFGDENTYPDIDVAAG